MATVTRYVNTASSGGDGTTNGTSGATAAYASLSAALSAEVTAFNGGADAYEFICTGGAETVGTAINLGTWTTSATKTLTIKSNDVRTTGFANGYRLERSATSGSVPAIYGIPNYVTFENIRIIATGTSTATTGCVGLAAVTYSSLLFDRCWFRVSGSSTGGKHCILSNATADNSTGIVVRNCILDAVSVSNGSSYGFSGDYATSAQIAFQNCTITGFLTAGVRSQQEAITVTNCAVFNNADDFLQSSGSITASYCASDDGDGSNAVNISPGATESTDWAAAFTDYANGDYSVKDTSSVLYDAGTAISGVTVDHVGADRGATLDIGAFEYITGGATPTITDAGDESYAAGETGITITGTNFGASQGSGSVKISPTDNVADSNAVTQTVTAWSDTSITFTCVRGSLALNTNLYLFVTSDGAYSNASGHVVQIAGTRKLKVLTAPAAASASGVAGAVFAAPTGGAITGAEIGEFTGATFEATLESGQAVLKVPVADFGGGSLTTSDVPVVIVRNTTHTTGIISATVIEE